jgi:hypothetical protein
MSSDVKNVKATLAVGILNALVASDAFRFEGGGSGGTKLRDEAILFERLKSMTDALYDVLFPREEPEMQLGPD